MLVHLGAVWAGIFFYAAERETVKQTSKAKGVAQLYSRFPCGWSACWQQAVKRHERHWELQKTDSFAVFAGS